MNSGTLGAISTVLMAIAFAGICYWALSPRRKSRFEEDALLPFTEDEQANNQNENKQADDSK
jgi:cytochrome c oxidase cbb3-type subunit 4